MFRFIEVNSYCFPSPSLLGEEEEKKDTALDALKSENLNRNYVTLHTRDGKNVKFPLSELVGRSYESWRGINPLDGTGVLPDDVVGLTFSKDIRWVTSNNYWRLGFKKLTFVNFEEGSELTTLSMFCFCYCYNLSKIFLPEGLVTIGENALECTNLKHINLPASLKKIGECAFWIDHLETIRVPRCVPYFPVCEGVKVMRYDTEEC